MSKLRGWCELEKKCESGELGAGPAHVRVLLSLLTL
jgi:hypothetical protein